MNIKTANRLCELRKKHGLSQEDLADKLGVSRQAISKWERSESSPDTDNLIELARIYDISLDELLNGEEALDVIEENKEADKEILSKEDEELIKAKNENPNAKDRITIEDDEGQTATFYKGKVYLKDENGNEKVISKKEWDEKYPHRAEVVSVAITAAYAILVTIAFVLIGMYVDKGFGKYWFLFVSIPVPGSIASAIIKKDGGQFLYPVFVATIYCALGTLLNLWHPGWVVFLTIPVYYIIASAFSKKKNK